MTRIEDEPDTSPFLTRARAPATGGYASILVGVDGNPGSDRALSAAIAVAAEDAALTLVGRLDGPQWSLLASGYVTESAIGTPREESSERLRSAAARVPPHLRARSVLRGGARDVALAAEANAATYDLVVLAAPAPGRLKAALGFGACARLRRACTAPLLVIPATAIDNRGQVQK